jgi:hypothetical protein
VGGGVFLNKIKKKLSHSISSDKELQDEKTYNIEFLEPYTKKLFETYTDESYKDINYFRSDLTRHLIVLKCIEYFSEINCVNELCERGILQRIENLNDKRSIIVKPTAHVLKLYAKLHYSYKKILYDF